MDTGTRARFEKWCPIKILDPATAPKANVLANAYWTAWQACEAQTSKRIAQRLRAAAERANHRSVETAALAWANEIEREYEVK